VRELVNLAPSASRPRTKGERGTKVGRGREKGKVIPGTVQVLDKKKPPRKRKCSRESFAAIINGKATYV